MEDLHSAHSTDMRKSIKFFAAQPCVRTNPYSGELRSKHRSPETSASIAVTVADRLEQQYPHHIISHSVLNCYNNSTISNANCDKQPNTVPAETSAAMSSKQRTAATVAEATTCLHIGKNSSTGNISVYGGEFAWMRSGGCGSECLM